MGIFTNAHQRLIAGKPAHFAVLHHGADIVRRGDHFDDAFVIAEQRRVVFIKQRGNQDNHQQGAEHRGNARQQRVPPFSGTNPGQCQHHGRHEASNDNPQNHLRGHQGGRFLRVGFEHVHNHVLIDHRAVGIHEIGRRGASDRQYNQQRLAEIRDVKQAKDNHPAAKQHQRDGGGKEEVVQMHWADNGPAALDKQPVQQSKKECTAQSKFNVVTL